jgi:hypothetical protein
MSGTEMQRSKEQAAEIMRQKQAAGTPSSLILKTPAVANLPLVQTAEAKKASGGSSSEKKK